MFLDFPIFELLFEIEELFDREGGGRLSGGGGGGNIIGVFTIN